MELFVAEITEDKGQINAESFKYIVGETDHFESCSNQTFSIF